MEDSRYRIPLPYPEVTVTVPDRRYAKMISGAYAGKGSETTTSAQYRIHTLYMQQQQPEILEAYQTFAVTETRHQALLGNILAKLCWYPKLCSGETSQFWNGRFPDQLYQLIPMLEADAQAEREAIAHYQQMIACIDNQSIQALFRRIIMDEQLHLATLTQFLAKYK